MRSFHKPLETANSTLQQAVSGFFTVRLHSQGLNRPSGGGKQKSSILHTLTVSVGYGVCFLVDCLATISKKSRTTLFHGNVNCAPY